MGEIARASATRAITPAQSTAISFVDDHGDQIVLTSDDVRMHICPKADAKEIAYFMELCRAQRLNPFLNEAYLVKFGSNPAQIMVAHKALVKRAEAHPQYDGMEHGVVVMRGGDIHHESRGAYYPEAGETLLGGWAKVYRKDRRMPIYAERSFKSMNKGQANWKSMPDIMIDKCAQAAALREAFPDELRSMYTPEEMEATPQPAKAEAGQVPPESKARIPYQKPEVASKEDLDWLRKATADLVALGFVESEVKSYLWATYKNVGINAARAWYESQMEQQRPQEAEYDPEGEQAGEYSQEGEGGAGNGPTAAEGDAPEDADSFVE